MTELKINLDGLKIHLDYLQEERHSIRLLQSHLERYIQHIQVLGNNDFYFFKEQLHTLKNIEENIDGRISFLEDLIGTHYLLTDNITQEIEEMNILLEMIEGEK